MGLVWMLSDGWVCSMRGGRRDRLRAAEARPWAAGAGAGKAHGRKGRVGADVVARRKEGLAGSSTVLEQGIWVCSVAQRAAGPPGAPRVDAGVAHAAAGRRTGADRDVSAGCGGREKARGGTLDGAKTQHWCVQRAGRKCGSARRAWPECGGLQVLGWCRRACRRRQWRWRRGGVGEVGAGGLRAAAVRWICRQHAATHRQARRARRDRTPGLHAWRQGSASVLGALDVGAAAETAEAGARVHVEEGRVILPPSRRPRGRRARMASGGAARRGAAQRARSTPEAAAATSAPTTGAAAASAASEARASSRRCRSSCASRASRAALASAASRSRSREVLMKMYNGFVATPRCGRAAIARARRG